MSAERPLSEELKTLLKNDGEPISVGRLTDKVGDRGFGLLLILLSLPSALPIPAAGYSVPFGILLLLLAWQMIAGYNQPQFPQKFRNTELSPKMAAKMIEASSWIFKRLEWFIRPRLRFLFSKPGRCFMGILILLMAILMMIPIPLTNTAPAFVIFLIGVALTEEDGLFGAFALFAAVAAVALYVGLIIAIILHGPEVVETIKETIKSWIG